MVGVETRHERAAGATAIDNATLKGKIVQFAFYMLKEAYAESTIEGRVSLFKTMLRRHAPIDDPDAMKEFIATQKTWGDGRKKNAVDMYSCLLAMKGLTWDPPHYKKPQKLPFIPLESELDQMIAGCGKKMAAWLQGCKETGADPGELWRVEWTDVDLIKKLVTINYPAKGHNPRILPISDKWISMIQRLPKKTKRVFGGSILQSHGVCFRDQRRRLAAKLGNPRILKIRFTTFRHWKGTMEYHKTRDPYHVKKILGHKHLASTEIYIHLEEAIFQTLNDEFHVKVAENIEEDKELIETGFEYVTERDCYKIYRKRK